MAFTLCSDHPFTVFCPDFSRGKLNLKNNGRLNFQKYMPLTNRVLQRKDLVVGSCFFFKNGLLATVFSKSVIKNDFYWNTRVNIAYLLQGRYAYALPQYCSWCTCQKLIVVTSHQLLCSIKFSDTSFWSIRHSFNFVLLEWENTDFLKAYSNYLVRNFMRLCSPDPYEN